ncbi:MAG: hypothetical protein ACD_24C00462G0001, partial [uncultured bacterium]
MGVLINFVSFSFLYVQKHAKKNFLKTPHYTKTDLMIQFSVGKTLFIRIVMRPTQIFLWLFLMDKFPLQDQPLTKGKILVVKIP